jgi:hypothetical protein
MTQKNARGRKRSTSTKGKLSEGQPVSDREGMVWGPPPRDALRWATFAWLANRSSRSVGKRERRLEAPPGFEPGVEVLQLCERSEFAP